MSALHILPSQVPATFTKSGASTIIISLLNSSAEAATEAAGTLQPINFDQQTFRVSVGGTISRTLGYDAALQMRNDLIEAEYTVS